LIVSATVWLDAVAGSFVPVSLTETQETILDAVQSVIVREGVSGASMRQVAEEAEVSLGLISYHFDDKDSLIAAAFERATSALRAASVAAAARVNDPTEKVIAFLRGSFGEDFLNSDYLRLRVSLWAVALSDPDIAAIDSRYYAAYASAFADHLRAALPAVSEHEITARTADVIALSNGLWLDWARFAKLDRLERGLLRCESIALHGDA